MRKSTRQFIVLVILMIITTTLGCGVVINSLKLYQLPKYIEGDKYTAHILNVETGPNDKYTLIVENWPTAITINSNTELHANDYAGFVFNKTYGVTFMCEYDYMSNKLKNVIIIFMASFVLMMAISISYFVYVRYKENIIKLDKSTDL